MLRHELYKIFNRKSVLIALLIFAVLGFLAFFVQAYGTRNALGNDAVYAIYKNYTGEITREKTDSAEKEVHRLNNIENRNSKEEAEYDIYSRIKMAEGFFYKYNMKLDEVRNNIKITNGYEKKQNQLLYNMLVKTGAPGIFYTGGWDNIIDFMYSSGAFIMAAMILIGLASVFTGEYSQGMDSVILCSKNGKKEIITAKMAASVIYIISIDIFFIAANIIINLSIYGVKGWNVPMQSLINYPDSPYAFTVLQYYIIEILVHLTGCITFGMIVLLISSLVKNTFIPFAAGGLLFMVPVIIDSIIPVKTPLSEAVILFSPAWIMQVERLFQLYRVYNIFGQPVLYPVLLMVLALIVITICRNYIHVNFRNYEDI